MAKDKQVQALQTHLFNATAEGLSEQVKGLTRQLAVVRRDLDTKTLELKESEDTIKNLKGKYQKRHERGKFQESSVENVELRFKVDSAENKQRVAEGKLTKQIKKNRMLEDRCEKIERALTNAKKVEFVERRFLEVIRLMEGHKTENRGEFKTMLELVKKETEERKNVQTKFALLKTEYKKLVEGELTIPKLQEELETLREENLLVNARLDKLRKEYQVLSKQKVLLEKELNK